jgi:hypothetical protein
VDSVRMNQAFIFEQFGRVGLHRPGASRCESALRTLGPGLGLSGLVTRCLLPCAFSGSVIDSDPALRLPLALWCSCRLSPNKAPEPTATSVTPRAISRSAELKRRTENRSEARVAPAVAVAHL